MCDQVAEQVERFFAGREQARELFDAILQTAITGQVRLRVTSSQIAFSHRGTFAWAWIPGRWLRGPTAPLVLSIALPRRDHSPRWKEVVEPRPGRWMHHLELYSLDDVDEEVRAWLAEAAA